MTTYYVERTVKAYAILKVTAHSKGEAMSRANKHEGHFNDITVTKGGKSTVAHTQAEYDKLYVLKE